MNKIKFITIVILLIGVTSHAQNVGINNTGTAPNATAELDLNTGNTFTSPNGKGLLIPNVALTSTGDNVTCSASPATSLLVYNTATAGASPTNVVPGFYYWNGAKWVALAGIGSNNWALLGNAGTTVGTNFLGTTDNQDLQFNANNKRSGLINIANEQTFFGYQAGLNTPAGGTLNSFFGAYSGLNTTGAGNAFFGAQAGQTNTSGATNTALGYYALIFNSTGSNNTAVGAQALFNATGSGNTAVGINAGYTVTTGANNTALGYYAFNNPTTAITGSHNTSIGESSGTTITSGNYNSFLGYNSSMSTGTFSNTTGVGSYSYPGANDVLVLGSIAGTNGASTSTKVGIGITTPTSLFHVVDGGSGYTTGNLATITGNSLTTGKGLLIQSSSLTSGNLLEVNATNAAGTTSNAIYASNSSPTGNVFSTVNSTNPGYSAIYCITTALGNGTSYSSANSNHALYGVVAGGFNYSMGIYGTAQGAGLRSCGVFGNNGNVNGWCALGYRSSGGFYYGEYCSNDATYGNSGGFVNGTGRESNNGVNTNESEASMPAGIGMGVHANLIGGWVKGGLYGMNVKGNRYSLYADGKTFTNDIIVQLNSNNGSPERTASYVPTSASVDIYARGKGTLQNGKANISFDATYSSQLSSEETVMVTITPTGSSNGLYVTEISSKGFKVIENNSGESDIAFSWIAVGVRKGYEKPMLPTELLSSDYDGKMNGVMFNENDTKNSATNMWWDGTTLHFEKQASTITTPEKKH